MVSSSSQLLAFLQTKQAFFGADLIAVTLTDGSSLFFSSFDRWIKYRGVTYTPAGPYASRSKLKMAVGKQQLQASSISMTLVAQPTLDVEGQPLLFMIATGRWTGATVTIRRVWILPGDFTASGSGPGIIPSQPIVPNLNGFSGGTGDPGIIRFVGIVGEVQECTNLSATLEVRDLLYLLNRPAPKNVYQPGCWHTFCDSGCTLTASDFTLSTTVQAGSTITVVNTTLTNDQNIPGAPTSAPSLSLGNLPVKTLPWTFIYCVVTYVTGQGETTASPESFIAVLPGKVAICASPPSIAGATGWNCYMGDGSGNEQLQNSSPIAIGTSFTAAAEGIEKTGVIPPAIPSTGYWALGQIKFTSGPNAGVSMGIAGSNSAGAIQLAAPLPYTPNVGDAITLFAGCAKTVQACQNRVKANGLTTINNIVHFTGTPAVPVPEIGSL